MDDFSTANFEWKEFQDFKLVLIGHFAPPEEDNISWLRDKGKIAGRVKFSGGIQVVVQSCV